MEFVEYYRLSLVFAMWSHLTMKYVDDSFKFIEVDGQFTTYKTPVPVEDWDAAVDSWLSAPELPMDLNEDIELQTHEFFLPMRRFCDAELPDWFVAKPDQQVWVWEMYDFSFGIGHLSKTVLYVEPVKRGQKLMTISPQETETLIDGAHYLWRYDKAFNGEEWVWNELEDR